MSRWVRIESLRTIRTVRGVLVLALLGCAFVSQARGQSAPPRAPADSSPAKPAGRLIAIDDTHILLPDIEVLNQEGKRVRFYSDLVKDKIVILSFFYSSCVNVCISLGESLSKAQASLGARLGKEVFFISVSMDPRTDTPPKLKYWWRAFGARPGWTLVASDTPEMNKMLTGFTGNSPGPKDMHSAFVFIGNDRTGAWKTVNGLLDAPSLIQLIETVDDAAGEAK